MTSLSIPAAVPSALRSTYTKNYTALTRGTDRLLLFACDHKIEHLCKDFYGPHIAANVIHPVHIFSIAAKGTIGGLATHLGLISRYGAAYPSVNYIIKLNAKTDSLPAQSHDPMSPLLWSVDDVVTFSKNSGLSICGVGYTLYLGGIHEGAMLAQAAHIVYQAHLNGLIAVLWIYPRGKYATDETQETFTIGAAGIGSSLGADFIKIKEADTAHLAQISACAGNSKILCAGGSFQDASLLFTSIYNQIQEGHTAGIAIGRNLFQRPILEAVAITKAVATIVYDNKDATSALALFKTLY